MRTTTWGVVALLLVLGSSRAAHAVCTTPPPPTITTMLAMPDGTQLRTNVYLKDSTRRTVLVMRGANAATGLCAETLTQFWPATATYDLVVQDMRGTGTEASGDFIYSRDGEDGRALIAWIDQQTWSQGPSGHIAMLGWSHSGIVDYLATPGASMSLRGIQPHFATGDLLNYGLYTGGVLHLETAEAVEFAAGTSWQDHVNTPMWDGYIIDDTQAATTNAVGLHTGGWFDVFGQATLDSFTRMQTAGGPRARNRQKVVIGPWIHGGSGAVPTPGDVTFPVSTTGDALLPQYGAAWQKGVLQDSWADWDALPAARIYMMGESPGGVWKSYPTWPPPAVELPLYFTADRALSGEHQPPGQVAFTSDPSDPVPTRGGTNNLMSCTAAYGGTCGPYDQSSIENRPDVVTFTLPPTPGAIVGRIHADVWISTDLPDVDLFVRMTDVYPDGRSILMAQGIQRARYRTGVCPALLVPNEPTLVRVDLQSTALTIAAGHSLRVSISASAGSDKTAGGTHTLYAVNPQNGDEFTGTHPTRAGTIQILVGAGHESALVVPVVGGTAAPPDERPVTTACAGSATPPDGAATSSDAGLDGKDDDLHSGCGCHAVSAHGAAGTIPILIAIASILRRRRAQRLPACRLQNAGP